MRRGRQMILIDARVNAFPGAHGIARSVMKLTAHMKDDDDDLALGVLVNPSRPQIFPLSGLPAHAEVISTDIRFGAVHRCVELARLMRAVRAAVLHVPYPTFVPLVRPCPIVVTLHDCVLERDVQFAGGLLRQVAMKVATRAVLRRAAAITAPSQASLADIRQHYPSAPHPTLVPNGVDMSQFGVVGAGSVVAARKLYQLPDQFILAVGAHRPHKNQEVLVRALAKLPEHVSLVIVGYFDPNFHQPLPGLIAGLGLTSRVHLIPEVDERWLPAVYRAASVFAFPSEAEGFGMPVAEAMAAGVPVVASDIPPVREVAGSAAVLVQPRDPDSWAAALAAVLADQRYAGRLSDAGLVVAESLSWERGAAALRALLAAVARGKVLPSAAPVAIPDTVGRTTG